MGAVYYQKENPQQCQIIRKSGWIKTEPLDLWLILFLKRENLSFFLIKPGQG